MASVVIAGDTSGSITVAAPAVAGSNTQTLVAATGTLAPLIQETAQTATGTAVDFTGIPSWVKRITVMFSGVSTSGTASPWLIQLGTSSGVEATGYLGASTSLPASASSVNSTTGFPLNVNNSASNIVHGAVTICLINATTYSWAAFGVVGQSDTARTVTVGGSKSLANTLDRVRITSNGTDTFDAGTINILYE